MSKVRVVSFDGLISRLRGVLGDDSLLFQRFDSALRRNDEEAIEAAMSSLQLYPQETRRAVEDAMLAWLFDQSDSSGLANMNTPTSSIN